MTTTTLLRTAKTLLFVTVVGTPLFYFAWGVYPYTLAKTLFFQAAVEALFFLWLALAIAEPRYRIKRTPLLLAVAAFLAVLLITSALGDDPARSFWSVEERAFGVVTFLHLAAFALVVSSLWREIPWKALWYASLAASAATGVIARLQLHNPDLLILNDVRTRPGATFGNPTFLAGYLVWHIFLAGYFLAARARARSRNVLEYLFLAATFLIDLYAVALAQTRGDLLGLGAGALVALALFAYAPPGLGGFWGRRSVYGAVLVAAVLFGAAFWSTRTATLWEHVPGLNRFRDVSLASPDLAPRFVALRDAWRGFLDRPLTGFGWDNFNLVFNRYYDPQTLEASYQETRFDKPHNVLAEYLVTGGIFLLLAYLVILAALAVAVYRGSEPIFAGFALGALSAHVVQNLFIFDTVGPCLLFFLLIGYADGAYRAKAEPAQAVQGRGAGSASRRVSGWTLGGAVAIALVMIYALNILSLQASYDEFMGYRHFVNGRESQAVASFKAALALWSPYREGFARDYATAVSEAFFYNPGFVPPADAAEAVAAMEGVAAEHPGDAYNHYALVDMYNEISSVDPQKYLPKAEAEAAQALALSPRRQEVYFSLAKTKTLENDYPAARALLEKALALDPRVPDAHFYLGLVAYSTGDEAAGYRELEAAIAMGRPWKNKYEPRVVANFFADSGHLGEAIGLYQASLALDPGDLETQIKLGIAYYFAGNTDTARQYIGGVAARFDLQKSSSYATLLPILKALGIKADGGGGGG